MQKNDINDKLAGVSTNCHIYETNFQENCTKVANQTPAAFIFFIYIQQGFSDQAYKKNWSDCLPQYIYIT